MNTLGRRRFVHLLAVGLCVMVGTSVAVLNVPERTTIEGIPGGPSIDILSIGRPVVFSRRIVAVDRQGNEFTPSLASIQFKTGGHSWFRLTYLLVDILFAVVLLPSTACVVYKVGFSPVRALRYNLKFLLFLFAVISAALAVGRNFLTAREMVLYSPIGFGVMCFVGTLAILLNRWISSSEQTIKRDWQEDE